MKILLFLFIFLYLGYLFLEKYLIGKYRKKFKYVIHVNGIRGKSTTSRLIDAGLRDSGFKVFTKITGTSPRIINTLGEEKEILRKGKANIKEQIKAIIWAHKENADILILECMAVNPTLQFICENSILKADINVITNVREDHLDEMGNTLDKIASSLANTIPTNGALFTADTNYFDFFQKLGSEKNSKAFLCTSIPKYSEIDFPDNVSIALSVCKYIGIKEEKALSLMKNYKRDPGRLKILRYSNSLGNNLYFLNALAANDPNSSEIIINNLKESEFWKMKKYLLINNRKDRVSRWEQYIPFVNKFEKIFDSILISGENRELFFNLVKKNIESDKINILQDKDIFEKIEMDSIIIAVGNICGHGKKLVDYFEEKGEVVECQVIS